MKGLGRDLPKECGCGIERKTTNTRRHPMYQPRELGYVIRYCLHCDGNFITMGQRQSFDTSTKTNSYTKRKHQYKEVNYG